MWRCKRSVRREGPRDAVIERGKAQVFFDLQGIGFSVVQQEGKVYAWLPVVCVYTSGGGRVFTFVFVVANVVEELLDF